MIPAIRDVHLEAAFETPASGLEALGLGAVELRLTEDLTLLDLNTGERVSVAEPASRAAYREHLREREVFPCAVLCDWRMRFEGLSDDARGIIRAIEIASEIEAPVVRVDPMTPREEMLPLLAHAVHVAEAAASALSSTRGTSVQLGVENHGIASNSLAFFLQIRRVADEPRLCLTLDPANFYWRGYPLQEVHAMVDLLAENTVHTHLKSIAFPPHLRDYIRPAGFEYKERACGLGEGDLDYAFILGCLKREGYAGALCIENEMLHRCASREEKAAALQADARALERLVENFVGE